MTSEAQEFEMRVEALTKRFGDLEAVKGISFEVPRGEIFGFLGPNGAGKSTTIKMLCTLLKPSGGRALVAGYDIVDEASQVRRNIGLVAEKIILYDRLTAEENLYFYGRMNHLPEAEIKARSAFWLDRMGMTQWKDKLAGTFSTGMKQRVNIARALLTSPRIMFLDEPTLGLDPQTTRAIRQFIKELAEQGVTVILTTHQMVEAEMLCDRISIMDHGSIVALDTEANLKNLISDGKGAVLDLALEGLTDGMRQDLGALRGVMGLAEPEAGRLRITTNRPGVLSEVMRLVEGAGGTISSVNTLEANLEDVFLHLTGNEMRVEFAQSAPSGHRRGAAGRTSRVR